MADFVLKAGGTDLPSPTTLSSNDEIIWSSDTGRTLSGSMIGDVIAEKKNLSIKWEWLTAAEAKVIKNKLVAGFFPIQFTEYGETLQINVYRGTIAKDAAGYIGDIFYYKSVSVDIIQR